MKGSVKEEEEGDEEKKRRPTHEGTQCMDKGFCKKQRDITKNHHCPPSSESTFFMTVRTSNTARNRAYLIRNGITTAKSHLVQDHAQKRWSAIRL